MFLTSFCPNIITLKHNNDCSVPLYFAIIILIILSSSIPNHGQFNQTEVNLTNTIDIL